LLTKIHDPELRNNSSFFWFLVWQSNHRILRFENLQISLLVAPVVPPFLLQHRHVHSGIAQPGRGHHSGQISYQKVRIEPAGADSYGIYIYQFGHRLFYWQ